MNKQTKILGIIPARYESSRFPGKPLARINDKPMIQWVFEGCEAVFEYLIVATDDIRIKQEVESFGGNAILTSPDHASGTERCEEALGIMEERYGEIFESVINVQGDEPLIRNEQLNELLKLITSNNAQIATLAAKFDDEECPEDPNIVKLILNKDHQALYFSRAPIPYTRDAESKINDQYLKHIGLYAYKSKVLKQICKLPVSVLEKAEALEQLRWLENGFQIQVGFTTYKNIGIDTPGDISKLKKYLNRS